MERKSRILFLALAGWLLLATPKLHAAVVRLVLEELVQGAELIVLGTVKRVVSKLDEGKISSFATITVHSKIKGELKGNQDEIVVRFSGGMVGNLSMQVESSPVYENGENVIIFLRKIQDLPYYRTLGLSQGKFLVKNDVVVRENTSLGQFLDIIDSILASVS